MMRVRNKIKPEIAVQLRGFVAVKGTTNARYTLRTVIELWKYKKMYTCALLTTPRHLIEYNMMR